MYQADERYYEARKLSITLLMSFISWIKLGPFGAGEGRLLKHILT